MLQVNVKEVLKSKAPELYKRIPRIVIWLLRRLIHEKTLNRGLAKCDGLKGIPFVTKVLDEILYIRREAVGLEDIPSDGKYIFVANHPLGGLDGMAILECINNRFDGVKALANDILLNIEPMKPLFLAINKHGAQSSSIANDINEHLASGAPLHTFPAGFCSRKINGEITDIAWNKNYLRKALEFKRDIVPIYVAERNSRFFYNIELLRKRLGIKFNIGMILLPHQLFTQRRRSGRVKMIFGEPISYHELSTTHDIGYWNREIRSRCYALKNKK